MNNEQKPDIWRLQMQFDTNGLVEALNNDDPAMRRRAAAALRALGAEQALLPLRQRLQVEADPATRAALLAALETLEGDNDPTEVVLLPAEDARTEKLAALVTTFKDADVPLDARCQAAADMAALGRHEATEPLVLIFKDPSQHDALRLAAAEALLVLDAAPMEVALLGALRSAEWRTRRKGAAILGQMQQRWAVGPLRDALKDSNDVVRRTALAALRAINTPSAQEAIRNYRATGALKLRSKPQDDSSPEKNRTRLTGPGTMRDEDTHVLQRPPRGRAARPNEPLQWPQRDDPRRKMPTKPLDPNRTSTSEHPVVTSGTDPAADRAKPPAEADTPPADGGQPSEQNDSSR